MENQHRKITGYRELSEAEITLMDEIKAKGEELRLILDQLSDSLNAEYQAHGQLEEPNQSALDTTYAALEAHAEAERCLKTGIMWLVRAVARPASF